MLDELDKKILRALSLDGSATATQIGVQVGLSVPATNKRIAKLRQSGVIRRFTVLADPEKVGKPLLAYVLIVVGSTENEKLLRYISMDPDILECSAVTGEYDYLIKICAKDVQTLEDKLLCLKKQKGVAKSHTMLSLMEHKFEPSVLPDWED